jgi:hypothetical protein
MVCFVEHNASDVDHGICVSRFFENSERFDGNVDAASTMAHLSACDRLTLIP